MTLDNLPDDEGIPSKKELYKREMKEYERQLENAETEQEKLEIKERRELAQLMYYNS